MRQLRPSSPAEAASVLAAAALEGEAVRIVGAATKLAWGGPGVPTGAVLHTGALDRILEHNEGDLTAVIEAGVRLADAQRRFASAGQMLAIDPFLGVDDAATVGGVIATADCGPLQHRYGAPRDLVLGMTVGLSDGTLARSGGKVIKNVAGYDIAKLFCGSFGTLGVILQVSVRLHPLPAMTATAVCSDRDPEVLAGAARALAGAPLELEALDLAWRSGQGSVLARCGGAQATRRADRVARLMRESGADRVEVISDDDELWAAQRAGQRSTRAALVRIASRPSAAADLLRAAAACDGKLVGRAALGRSYVEIEPDALRGLSERLPPQAGVVVLDAPAEVRGVLDPWGPPPPGRALELMRSVKARFDPARACNPGVFVGGI